MRSTVLASVVLSFAVPAAAAQIDAAGEPSLVIGSDGLGLVAYKDTTSLDLKVAHCVDAACSAVTTVTVDSTGDVGGRASLALRPGGLPVISYEDATNGDLKLALCADALCSTASTVVVDPDLLHGDGGRTEVAIGGDGLPLIAYVSGALPVINGGLRVAHCNDPLCATATITELAEAYGNAALRIAGDGRGTVASTRYYFPFFNGIEVRHCNDAACTSASLFAPPALLPSGGGTNPSVAIDAGGLPAFTYTNQGTSPPPGAVLVRCQDFACNAFTQTSLTGWYGRTSLAIDGADRPRVVAANATGLRVLQCADAACSSYQDACLASSGGQPSLALDAAGMALVAFVRNGTVRVTPPVAACPAEPALLSVFDRRGDEFFPTYPQVFLSDPSTSPVTVNFATVDGTAQAGADYIATAGTLTFAPGETSQSIEVVLVDDAAYEADETFEVVLSSPSGATIVDDRAVVTIADDDGPEIRVADCGVGEGDTGSTECEFEVRLSFAPIHPVTVNFTTRSETATATEGIDYLRRWGTLTFAPGTLAQSVPVSVLGDVVAEPDEDFLFVMSNEQGAVAGDLGARGYIVDDDSPSLSSLELTHGASLTADLRSDPGPTADRDDYRVSQPPYTSHEFVLDAVSGDAAPGVRLERIAADGSTVLQTSVKIGAGSAVALRFENDLPATVNTQYVRVAAASCDVACGPDDVYRLRAYETTGTIPRFNNGGSQASVLILQNATSRGITGTAHFWDPAGGHRASRSVVLPPRATSVESIAGIPGLSGVAGSITVTHDGPYGGLVGKAVALEPSTGFSFDSPMVYKPR